MSAGPFPVRSLVRGAYHPNAATLQERHPIGAARLMATITIARPGRTARAARGGQLQ